MPRRRKTLKLEGEEGSQSVQEPPPQQPTQGRGHQLTQVQQPLQSRGQEGSPSGQQAAAPPGRAQHIQHAPSLVSRSEQQTAAPSGRAQQVQQAPSQMATALPGPFPGPSVPQGRDGTGQGHRRVGGPAAPVVMASREPYMAAAPVPVPDLPQPAPYNLSVGEQQTVQYIQTGFGAMDLIQGAISHHLMPILSESLYTGLQNAAVQTAGAPPAAFMGAQLAFMHSSQSLPVPMSQHFQNMAFHRPPTHLVQEPGLSNPPVLAPPTSSKKLHFPRRPGFGQAGSRCIVKANHFVAELPDKDLHQYDVSITPEVTSRGVNRAVMEQLVKVYQDSALDRRLPAYDGRKSLYTAGPLPFQSKDFTINLLDEDDGSGAPRRERQFKVVIKFSARADLHRLGEFLSGRQADAPQEALQVLDIVLRELPTHRFCPVGRSFYSPDLGRRQPLGEGLEIWRGFYQSIRPTQMGLSLNIDMSSTAFIEPLPVLEFVAELLGKDVSRHPVDADRIKIKKALRGVKVEVTHRGNLRRKYRISGLTSQPTHELTFPVDEKGTIKSVVEYFQETYSYTIRNTALPCLQVGNQQRPNYLPMEVCKIVDGQRYSKRLNEKQITALLKVTCQRPMEREMNIMETVYHNRYAQDPYAKEFGMKISDRLAAVEARILPAPQLKYHDTGKQKYCQPEVGQWNMRDKKMVNGGIVVYWACINFSRGVQESVARRFCQELVAMCQVSGMSFSLEPAIPVHTARPDQVERALREVFQEFQQTFKQKELELLVVILPDNNGTLYGDLKRICETDLGLVSQCCLTKHVHKRNKQYLANVALKINVKVGGRNTVLVDALSRRIPLVSDIPTIIFGADVTHPHPGEDSSPSIAAVVASQDWPEVTKYAGLVCAQEHRQELIQDLFKSWVDPVRGVQTGGMIKELLISFRRATGQRPLRIIFYRDGVSEGQFYQVLLYELDAIRKACASLEPNYQPPVTFVVVQKRHHTRLFANNHNDRKSTDDSGNILPGTVVDTRICHPREFDFYLCSHAGIQGTSRPAHYHVLWDENNFTADGLQLLTNNLCYTYARCTRSVSIVPPAYYAHLAAFRARFYMEPESDSGSLASGIGPHAGRPGNGGSRSSRAPAAASVRPLPPVKENVRRVMFYC